MTKSANSEACFSEARSERILEPSGVDFGTIFGGLGDPKWRKMRSRNQVKKRVAKKSCKGAQEIQDEGAGALYNVQ